MQVKPRATDRDAPGVGSGSMKHFQDKFHKSMLRTAKSRLSNQFNDGNVTRRRDELKLFKREQGLEEMRQIDKNNLKMFVRLSAVQPSVPMVVKRSFVQQVELQPIVCVDRVESEDQFGDLPSPMLHSTEHSNEKRSISMPRNPSKFKLKVQNTTRQLASPRAVQRSCSNVVPKSSEVVNQSKLYATESQLQSMNNGAIQSMTQLPMTKTLKQADSNAFMKDGTNKDMIAESTTCTLKTRTQWYLKAPSKNSFYDESYKVVPSLNHAQRVMKLNQITRDNLKMFERLQGVKSDYDATKLLQKDQK